MQRPAFPVALLLIGLVSAMRFMANVRAVDAVGLLGSGALIGVSAMRLMFALRRR